MIDRAQIPCRVSRRRKGPVHGVLQGGGQKSILLRGVCRQRRTMTLMLTVRCTTSCCQVTSISTINPLGTRSQCGCYVRTSISRDGVWLGLIMFRTPRIEEPPVIRSRCYRFTIGIRRRNVTVDSKVCPSSESRRTLTCLQAGLDGWSQ